MVEITVASRRTRRDDTVTRQFHDVVLARVHMGDGTFSDCFEVIQGLRQGRVLSPLHMFFAEAL